MPLLHIWMYFVLRSNRFMDIVLYLFDIHPGKYLNINYI